MYIPKRYGESKMDNCPFCNKIATAKNEQEIPVCIAHKNSVLDDFRCACGSLLELRSGKFGPFFNCINCGNINFKRAMEINVAKDVSKKELVKESNNNIKKELVDKPKKEKVEFFIDSDDPRFFD